MTLPKPGQIKSVLMLVGIVGAGYLAYKTYSTANDALETASEIITEDLNPASDENIVYTNTPAIVKDGLNGFWGALDSVGLLPK
ncbi:MAG: hypothetical protein QM500_21430 [Methylococcales bacterium]